jgi:signal transduction histidine kinase
MPPSPHLSLAEPATPSRGARILIVDDEPGIREMLARELTTAGYFADSAANALDALDMMEREKYHVVLCDLNMPKLGGIEALERFRKRDTDIEVIMMTGYATVETAVAAMKKGAYDFVEKPFNLEEVLALVDKSLEKSELRRTITELREIKKKLEQTQMQLIQSEKLAGIGQLAAGVAHELNNPLSGVMGFAQLLLADPTLTAQQRSDVETICGQSQRCRVIIQNLLQFSRRKDPVSEPVDIAPLLQATVDLVKYDFSTSGIDLIQKIPASLPMVFGDANQLQQVFLNLITNARQAMEAQKKGRLLIEGKENQGRVQILFTDEGPGIPKEILGKVFDPFFTTKPPGKGTGLGLSICYGIVLQHQGDLRVESEVGLGTTFTLELPIHK